MDPHARGRRKSGPDLDLNHTAVRYRNPSRGNVIDEAEAAKLMQTPTDD